MDYSHQWWLSSGRLEHTNSGVEVPFLTLPAAVNNNVAGLKHGCLTDNCLEFLIIVILEV